MAFQDALRIFFRNDPKLKGYSLQPYQSSDPHSDVIGAVACPRKHTIAFVDDKGGITDLGFVRVDLADPAYFSVIKKICNHVICQADPDWKRYDSSDDIQWMDDLLRERDGNP